MAVKPANSRYHTFTFNGVRAADYGIYVTDVNVFNSAARDVEYIQIPGRDGAFALDRGRFQNISVVYKCAMTQDTDEDFATAISEFRNAIASTKGYKRLEDDIHTDEYRMGVFSKGLEAPTLNTKTATFDVEFNCQPQRFLKSGETAVSVASGGTITNPTLFESHPLLHVWGYGDIGIGGDTLSINNDEYGRTLLANRLSKSATSVSSYLDESAVLMLNSGDDVFVSAGSSVVFPLTFRGSASINIISATIANSSPYDFPMESSVSNFGNYVTVSVSLPQLDFIFNQTLQHLRSNIRVTINYTEAGVSKTSTAECQIHAQYSLTPLGRYRVALFYYDVAVDKFHNPSTAVMTIQPIYGVSTQRPFSDDADFYFDLDIGEAYKIEDGQIISVNNAVTIPAQLPTLKSGANTIAYDDTITQFKVVPRWWEV